jgi:hypothetical protein
MKHFKYLNLKKSNSKIYNLLFQDKNRNLMRSKMLRRKI